MPDLYGRKAWIVIGLTVGGWVLAVIFMLAYVGMYYVAYHYYEADAQLLNATVNALNTYNQIMGRLVNDPLPAL